MAFAERSALIPGGANAVADEGAAATSSARGFYGDVAAHSAGTGESLVPAAVVAARVDGDGEEEHAAARWRRGGQLLTCASALTLAVVAVTGMVALWGGTAAAAAAGGVMV